MSRAFWVSQQEFMPAGMRRGYVVGEGNVMRAFLPGAAGSDARELALAFAAANDMINLLRDILAADEESIKALAEMDIPVSEQSHTMTERIRAVLAKVAGES